MTPEEIAELFQEMEAELFDSMARNLKRHEAWEAEEGFEWVQWQAEMINGLRDYREEVQDIVNGTYNKAIPEMEKLLKDAYHFAGEKAEFDLARFRGRNVSQRFFSVSPRMRSLIENVLYDVDRTRYAALNRMNSKLVSVVQKVDLMKQFGTITLPQAVDRASRELVAAGLDCIEYKNGARVSIDSYVEMVLRTSGRDAASLAEGEKRDEWGEYYVITTIFGMTCPICAKWQGKVLIDDVYAHGKPDGKHTMLSTAKADGFLHPNCGHKPVTYMDGITELPDPVDEEESRKSYEAQQKQRYYERNIRKYKRLEACATDPENKKKYADKVKEWNGALNDHLKENPYLRKRPWRTSDSRIGVQRPKALEMKRRRTNEDGREVIDQPTYNKLTKSFKRNGGIIDRSKNAEIHLQKIGANASYFAGANVIFFREEPTISDVLEETFHAKQDRRKAFGDKLTNKVYLLREIEAQEYLLSMIEEYKIPIEQTEQTIKNLEYYKEQYEKLYGR